MIKRELTFRSRPYPIRIYAYRVAWGLFSPIIRINLPFFSLKNLVLRCFGARIGKSVRVYGGVKIYFPFNLSVSDYSTLGHDVNVYNLAPVSIGSHVTISQESYLCSGTHNYLSGNMELLKKPINIGDNVWLCARSFVGPGVVVGASSILGACSVAMRSLDSDWIYVGNPAVRLRQRNNRNGGSKDI